MVGCQNSCNIGQCVCRRNICVEHRRRGCGSKDINFNEERYLLVCTAGQGSASTATIALEIYDLSKGATIEEALRKFDEGDNHIPLYQFKLGGSGNGNALAQTDYYIEKDENGKDAKLCVFASRTGSGFVICEFPIKQEEE